MIMAGVPLTEPYLWCYLSSLAKEERNGLESGRLPISDTFYLMGTSRLTDTLNPQEVFVVLEHGQIYGEVLAYRNPGLQFGDIHRLLAVPVKNLGDIIGNAKYGIFFSTKDPRSAASRPLKLLMAILIEINILSLRTPWSTFSLLLANFSSFFS